MSIPHTQQTIQLALQHHQAGRLAEAESLYRQVLKWEPHNAGVLHLLGLVAYQTGNLEPAVELVQKAIVHNRQEPLFHFNLGRIRRDQGRIEDAVACYRKALQLKPDYPEALNNLGTALKDSGRIDEAIGAYRRALSLKPQDPRAHHNLATALKVKDPGGLNEAIALYREALRLKRDYWEAEFDLGNALQGAGQAQEAIACYRRVLRLAPEFADAYYAMGSALLALNRGDEAVAFFRQAIRVKPEFPDALNGLGLALHRPEDRSEAIRCLAEAVRLKPEFAEAHYNLGNALQDEGRLQDAGHAYLEAIRLKPEFAKAHCGMGYVLYGLNRLEDADQSFREALRLESRFIEAMNGLGLVLSRLGRLSQSIACYRKTLELDPGLPMVLNNLAMDLKEWGEFDEALDLLRGALRADPASSTAEGNILFVANYHPDLPAEAIFAEYRRWDAVHARALAAGHRPHLNRRDPAKRLRVGYVSPDFRAHAAQPFIEPLLAHHHEAEVDLYLYAEVKIPDAVTERFRAMADHWCVTVGLSDEALAERIRADGIDILVDLAGHTDNNRLLAFARRPAPVQVTYLGYGTTTGMGAIDYFMADPHFVPEGAEPLFSERICRLPQTVFAYRPSPEMPPVGPLPAQKNGHLTFGCFSRTVRLNHRVIALWARLLTDLPTARLVLNALPFVDAPTRELFHSRFEAHGVARERLDLVFTYPQAKTWETYNSIDIALDPFPHNAGTTTFEALWMGVPVISLADRPPLGRFGATILHNVGLADWLATTPEAYLAIARRAAADTAALAALRAGLRALVLASPLCHEEAFASRFEQACRKMWQTWCEQAPSS